jgi:hypothetical protein
MMRVDIDLWLLRPPFLWVEWAERRAWGALGFVLIWPSLSAKLRAYLTDEYRTLYT